MIANHMYVPSFSGFIGLGDLVIMEKSIVMKIVNIINKDGTITLKGKKLININNVGVRILQSLTRGYPITTSAFSLMPRDKIQELVFTKNTIVIKANKVKNIAFIFKANDIEDGIYDICGISNTYLIRYELRYIEGKKKLIGLTEWKEWDGLNRYRYNFYYMLCQRLIYFLFIYYQAQHLDWSSINIEQYSIVYVV